MNEKVDAPGEDAEAWIAKVAVLWDEVETTADYGDFADTVGWMVEDWRKGLV